MKNALRMYGKRRPASETFDLLKMQENESKRGHLFNLCYYAEEEPVVKTAKVPDDNDDLISIIIDRSCRRPW